MPQSYHCDESIELVVARASAQRPAVQVDSKADRFSNGHVPAPIVPAPIVPAPIVPAPIVPEPIVPEPIVPEPNVPEPIVLGARRLIDAVRRAGTVLITADVMLLGAIAVTAPCPDKAPA